MRQAGVLSQRAILLGVARYEFRMQIRRRVLWAVYGMFSLLLFRVAIGVLNNPELPLRSLTLLQQVATVTVQLNWLPALGIGVFLADRFPRDRNHKVDELFEAMPGSLQTRLSGKYLGCVLASITPAFLCYMLFVGLMGILYAHSLLVLPYALLSYIIIVLPGLLFIAAFSLSLTSVLWVPLYQFLFVGYWFWGNMLGPTAGIPTLSGTILTPIGSYICSGLFGVSPMNWLRGATPVEGAASLVVLLVIPALVMTLFYALLKREQARK
jgi:ABC-2 type transport system permease protein